MLKRRHTGRRIGIRLKLALIIYLSIFVAAVVGLGLGYFLGYKLIKNTIGEENAGKARLLAISVVTLFQEEIDDITAYAANVKRIRDIKNTNLIYKDMENETIQTYLMEKDKKWIEAAYDHPLIEELLSKESSIGLKVIVAETKDITEIFITDKFGGLVAASGKTTDFYQADEEWWQEAYKGNIYIGGVEFDESSQTWCIVVAAPIKDEENEIIGACKAIVDVKSFFSPLEMFKFGKSGHAALVDERGYILYCCDIKPLSTRLYEEKHFQKLLNSMADWGVIEKGFTTKEKTVVAFAKVKHPILQKYGMVWRVSIEQNADEIFEPLNTLMLQLTVVICVLIFVTLPIGFIFGNIIVTPIKKLRNATGRIATGDLDYEVELETGDELGELAVSFNEMARGLKKSTTSIENLNKEIAERKKAEDELKKAYANLKEAQIQLMQSEKMALIGRMAAGVAHEINNPLSVISGEAEMLLKDKNREIRDASKAIVEQADRIKMITERLLEFSRKKELKLEPLDINNTVGRSISLLEHQVKAENIEIIKELNPKLPKVSGDSNQLQEVFLNIMLNATQAMKEGGRLTIRTRSEKITKYGRRATDILKQGQEVVAIEFEDTGRGMDEKTLEKIFDPFFTTKEKGVGLGLSICYGIMQNHRGIIEAHSRLEKGSTFIVKLPI